jgi:hypothetical protein
MEQNLNTVNINCGAHWTKNFFVYSKLMLVFHFWRCGCCVRDICIRYIFYFSPRN